MSSVDPVHKSVYIEGKKTFVPLENNPVVFDALIRSLGVSSSLSFYDIWSIDSDEALAHVPRPVYALIFICPAAVYYTRRASDFPPGVTDVKTLPQYEGYGDKEPVIWYKQTIRHACGLIALLHSINAVPTSFIDQDSVISTLVKTVTPLQVEERADVLYNSPELEQLHMQAAQQGDTPAPSSAEENGFHFIAFVKGKDGNLWELEGGWNGPICRGKLDNDTDVLSKAALNAGIDPFLKAAERSGEMGFSMIALAPASAD
ncbi:hypothetical protein MBLNU459_g3202t1 [Dothideomycetes sp. NU459]